MNGISATTLLIEAPETAVTRCKIGFRAIAEGDWIEAARQFHAAACEETANHEWAAKAFLFSRELSNIAIVQSDKQF